MSYIKFTYKWIKTGPLDSSKLINLNKWRDKLFSLSLIGSDKGIGYGNLSIRNNKFIITGSQTGILDKLNENHFTEVTEYDFKSNSLTCKGPIKASSESLTHAAVYESSSANAVIHVHHLELWSKLINKVPTTSETAEYGSPELVYEIMKLDKKNMIIMGGHESGIITFGKDLDEAGNSLLTYLNR